MANVANDGIMAEVNRMLEEMFLLETGMGFLSLGYTEASCWGQTFC
ncbi:unnamed protein product [Brassica rapa subsp. narinosa]